MTPELYRLAMRAVLLPVLMPASWRRIAREARPGRHLAWVRFHMGVAIAMTPFGLLAVLTEPWFAGAILDDASMPTAIVIGATGWLIAMAMPWIGLLRGLLRLQRGEGPPVLP